MSIVGHFVMCTNKFHNFSTFASLRVSKALSRLLELRNNGQVFKYVYTDIMRPYYSQRISLTAVVGHSSTAVLEPKPLHISILFSKGCGVE